ncbi:MAG TPA: hypothetical protein VLS89_06945 [Candidatus Nanopelagicales bacterium]|nr:hypothetical protein [Candidatus Nanopelagicales bacterium]
MWTHSLNDYLQQLPLAVVALNLRALLRRRGALKGSRRRPGPISAELLAIQRGVYDAEAAIENPWNPEHDCPHCVAERARATERPSPGEARPRPRLPVRTEATP